MALRQMYHLSSKISPQLLWTNSRSFMSFQLVASVQHECSRIHVFSARRVSATWVLSKNPFSMYLCIQSCFVPRITPLPSFARTPLFFRQTFYSVLLYVIKRAAGTNVTDSRAIYASCLVLLHIYLAATTLASVVRSQSAMSRFCSCPYSIKQNLASHGAVFKLSQFQLLRLSLCDLATFSAISLRSSAFLSLPHSNARQ